MAAPLPSAAPRYTSGSQREGQISSRARPVRGEPTSGRRTSLAEKIFIPNIVGIVRTDLLIYSAYDRQVPTHRYRLDVINFFASHGMPATLERFYLGAAGSANETKRKSLHLWSKRRDKLKCLHVVSTTGDLCHARHAGATTTLPRDAELDLLK
ncbi:hypothetical protein PybrP1_003639 [[Pythium] brassicae (nom. inval.)]|nr:hypothetical protein PybrP1_003639 [[Pythium] brassicae (nom. inval.)]